MDESKYSSGSQLKSPKKKHDMVLSLGRSTMTSTKDETPTPTKFLKKCDEVGLFQEDYFKKVNPFEETFRKAAEAVTTSNVSSILSLSRSTNEDTLHTPHVFPNTPDEDSRSKTSSMGDESITEEMLDGSERVVRQEADTSILCATPTLPTPIHPPFPLPGSQYLTPIQPSGGFGLLVGGSNQPSNSNNNEVQLCLKVSHGTTLELAGNTLKILGGSQPQPVQPKPPNIILDTSEDMRTVIFASQQHDAEPKQGTTDVKQKLKHFLGHSKVKKHVSSPRKSIKFRESLAPKKISSGTVNIPPISYEPEASLHNEHISHNVSSREGTSDDKIKLLREKNRAAAMRCRERKKAWVAELGRRADYMSTTNRALVQEVKLLRAEVARLKALLLTHKDCPVTLAASAGQAPPLSSHQLSEEKGVPVGKREERRRSHQLSLDIESATRRSSVLRSDSMSYSIDGCIDLSTPQDLSTQDLPSPLVRRDEILTSVAPTTPTDLPTSCKPSTPNLDSDMEMIGERSLATPVIQLNPNAKGKDHGYR